MADFTGNSFSIGSIGAGNASPKLAMYSTNDTQAEVVTADYFVDKAPVLAVGDWINCSADLDGTPVAFSVMVSKVVRTLGSEEVDVIYPVIA